MPDSGRHRAQHGQPDASEALQADVMRFVAILALCLVAIFALVQSLPRELDEASSASQRHDDTAEPVASDRQPPVRPAAVSVQAPAPVLTASQPVVTESAASAPEPLVDEQSDAGLVLRFTSDSALMTLVARGDVSVYTRSAGSTRRLTFDRGHLALTTADAPRRFHTMNPATIPAPVLATTGATVEGSSQQRSWLVTLPAHIEQQIDRLTRRHDSGTLAIDARGTVRHRPGS